MRIGTASPVLSPTGQMVDVKMRVLFKKLYDKESIRLRAMLHSVLNKLSVNSKSKSITLIILSINFNLVILLKAVCLPLVEICQTELW